MKVTFVLPGASPMPAGGPRMVFRYANALARSNWGVTVMMPQELEVSSGLRSLVNRGRFWRWKLRGDWSPAGWMPMDPRVRLSWVPNLDPRRAPAGDAVVATAVQTAEAVTAWPAVAGRKFYFVQGYETWDFPAERVEASWRLPLRKIAVSRWLCELIAAAGTRADYVPNGLDHDGFGLDREPEDRDPASLVWPYHPGPLKGSADVLAALPALLKAAPALRIRAFGTAKPPTHWPVPVGYIRNPAQAVLRELYNASTMAVAPSHSEGWGLPACEALQCGCALAASDVGGHREFLRDDGNALLHRPGDVGALTDNLLRLLRDPTLRLRLARQGVADMAKLAFPPSVEKLKTVLQETEMT